ncbi:MAG: alanine dehydrogenase [Gemmatimonadales bacterium]|nr:alanine dehydrogenase [Gemmatimonadales bacterium]
MIIGVPRETHRHEHRVGLTPVAVRRFVGLGHQVVVERSAGLAARFADREYEEAGAQVVYSSEEAFRRADLVCKIGVISSEELALLKPGLVIGAFHHLAVTPRSTVERLCALEVTAIGYELIQDAQGRRPILVPFSEMAGQMAVYLASYYLQNELGGRGILLGRVPGIAPPTVLILGAGTVGRTAARRALAIGAHVIVLDERLAKLRAVSQELSGQVVTQLVSPGRLAQYTRIADVVIGAVLIPGARAPFLVTEEMVKAMRPGSVIIDLSIDQGGCVETSRPRTPDTPTYVVHDIVHYCVPNMTANVARTASRALADAAQGLLDEVVTKGITAALRDNPGFAAGTYLYRGHVVQQRVAAAHGLPVASLADLLAEDRGTMP